jgi:hypothetical protein
MEQNVGTAADVCRVFAGLDRQCRLVDTHDQVKTIDV